MRKYLSKALAYGARLSLAYLAGRAIVLGEAHERRRQEQRTLALRKSVERHPSGIGGPFPATKTGGDSSGSRMRGYTGTTR